MRGLVILTIIVVLLGAGIWMAVIKNSMSDQGVMLLIVMGNPKEKTVEFAVSIDLGMANRARPRLDERMNPLWDEWIEKHFEMRDAAGEKASFTRVAHTLLVDERKVKHIPEFYIQYEIKRGVAYQFDYIPGAKDKTRYRHEFTASDVWGPTRVTFHPVEGKG